MRQNTKAVQFRTHCPVTRTELESHVPPLSLVAFVVKYLFIALEYTKMNSYRVLP